MKVYIFAYVDVSVIVYVYRLTHKVLHFKAAVTIHPQTVHSQLSVTSQQKGDFCHQKHYSEPREVDNI